MKDSRRDPVEIVPNSTAVKPPSIRKPRKSRPTTSSVTPTSSGSTTSTTASTTSSSATSASGPVRVRKSTSADVEIAHKEAQSDFDPIGSIVQSLRKGLDEAKETRKENRRTGKTGNPFIDVFGPPVGPSSDAPKSVEPKKPQRSWLDKHPLVAEQVKLALEGDEGEASQILANILDQRYQTEYARTQRKLDRRVSKLYDYSNEAQEALESGDIDWLQENPIKPKWTRTPGLKGINSKQDQLEQMNALLKAHPDERDSIREFFSGVPYTSFGGMVDVAHDRQELIKDKRGEMDKALGILDSNTSKWIKQGEEWGDWSEEDEAKQDAEREAKSAKKRVFEVEFNDQGEIVSQTMSEDEVVAEVKRRIRTGVLIPGDMLSMLDNSDVLTGPNIKLPDVKDEEGWGGIGGFGNLGRNSITDKIEEGVKHVVDPTADVLWAAIDKLSRPLYGINAMREEWSRMDKEPTKRRDGLLDFVGATLPYTAFTGKSPLDSVDDLSPGGVGDLFKAGWSGFSDGGWGNADNPRFGAEVIAFNAERDGRSNVFDNQTYQTVFGLGSDIAFDPLSYVGLGVGRQVLSSGRNLSKKAKVNLEAEQVKLNALSDEVTKLFEGTDAALSSEEFRRILSGGYNGRLPRTAREKAERARNIREGAAHIRERIDWVNSRSASKPPKEISELKELSKSYETRLQQVIDEYEGDTLRDTLIRDLNLKLERGEITEAQRIADDPDRLLTVENVSKYLDEANTNLDYLDDVALRMGRTQGKYQTLDEAKSRWLSGAGLSDELPELAPNAKGSYSSLRQDYIALQEAASQDPKLVPQLQAFEERMATAYDEAAKARPEGKDLLENLPNLKDDPRLGKGEVYKALRVSRDMARNPKHEVSQSYQKFTNLEKRLNDKNGLRAKVKADEAFLVSGKVPSEEVRKVSKRLEHNRRDLAAAEKQVQRYKDRYHNTQADVFIQHLGASAKGPEAIAQTQRARSLTSLMNDIQATIKSKNLSNENPGSFTGLKGTAREDDIAERADGYLDSKGLYDKSKVLEPNADLGFTSHFQQLKQIEKWAKDEYAKISPDDIVSVKYQQLAEDIPSVFKLNGYGKIDNEIIKYHAPTKNTSEKGYISYNKNTGTFERVRSTGNPEYDEWLTNYAQALEDEFQTHFRAIQNKKDKAANKADTEKAEAAWLAFEKANIPDANRANQVMAMFASKVDGQVKWASDASGSVGFRPVVPSPITGEPLMIGNADHAAELRSLAIADDVKSVDDAQGIIKHITKERRTDAGVVTSLKNIDDVDATYALAKPLIDELKKAGMVFPGDKMDALRVLVARRQTVLDQEMSLEQVVGRRIFEAEHGMTLREAHDLREIVLHQTAGADAPGQWGEMFPDGITSREFLELGLGSPTTFRRLFEKAPFKVASLTSKSELQARTAAGNAIRKKRGESQADYQRRVIEAQGKGTAKWVEDNWKILQSRRPEARAKFLRDVFKQEARRKTAAKAIEHDQFVNRFKAEERQKRKFWQIKSETADEALPLAYKSAEEKLRTNGLMGQKFDATLELKPPVGASSSTDDLISAVRKKKGEEYASKIEELRAQRTGSSPDMIDQINKKIAELQKEYKIQQAAWQEQVKEARAARAIMKTRLSEDAIIRAASASLGDMRKTLQLNVMGARLNVPGSAQMFKTTEKLSNTLGLTKIYRDTWGKAFTPPSSTISEELQLFRNRRINSVPAIIEHHSKTIMKRLGGFRDTDRAVTFSHYMNNRAAGFNNDPKIAQAIEDEFQSILNDITGKNAMVGEHRLTIEDINRHLPRAYKINYHRAEVLNTPADLIKSVTKGYRDKKTGKDTKAHFKELNDPYAVAWNLRIGIETAKAEQAMYNSIKQMFGVRKGTQYINPKTPAEYNHNIDVATISKLEDHGWRDIDALGHHDFKTGEIAPSGYLFPPEAVDDIERLIAMFDPKNTNDVSNLIEQAFSFAMRNGLDKPTRAWKAAVTMYNPGYYTRNLVGEVMSSWLAGVNSVTPYAKSAKLIKFAMSKEGKDMKALLSQEPLAKHLELGEHTVKGSDVALTMRNGRKVTYDDLWIGYNDRGLKTGFFNTDFGNQVTMGSKFMDRGPVRRGVRNIHRGVRTGGEGFEDYLRAAHYIDVIRKSGAKTFEEALDEASTLVRKYHFDYTDFTQFEKAVMLRAFPFYKWTRKAMPLMATMLFTKPGKMMMYPKTMNALSNELTSQDIAEDTNGYAPNFTGIAPSWVQNLWGYQIAEENSSFLGINSPEGGVLAGRLATPQMDSLTAMNGLPGLGNTAYTLMNPIPKLLGEQLTGSTWADNPQFGSNDIDIELDSPTERLKHIMRGTPQGNFAQKSIGENRGGYENTISGADWASFLSGLGVYDTFLEGGSRDNTDSLPSGLTSAEPLDTPAPVGIEALLEGYTADVSRRRRQS